MSSRGRFNSRRSSAVARQSAQAPCGATRLQSPGIRVRPVCIAAGPLGPGFKSPMSGREALGAHLTPTFGHVADAGRPASGAAPPPSASFAAWLLPVPQSWPWVPDAVRVTRRPQLVRSVARSAAAERAGALSPHGNRNRERDRRIRHGQPVHQPRGGRLHDADPPDPGRAVRGAARRALAAFDLIPLVGATRTIVVAAVALTHGLATMAIVVALLGIPAAGAMKVVTRELVAWRRGQDAPPAGPRPRRRAAATELRGTTQERL